MSVERFSDTDCVAYLSRNSMFTHRIIGNHHEEKKRSPYHLRGDLSRIVRSDFSDIHYNGYLALGGERIFVFYCAVFVWISTIWVFS